MDEVLIRFRLVGNEARALRDLCAKELREPRDQARLLLRQELKRRGLLTTEPAPAAESQGTQHDRQG